MPDADPGRLKRGWRRAATGLIAGMAALVWSVSPAQALRGDEASSRRVEVPSLDRADGATESLLLPGFWFERRDGAEPAQASASAQAPALAPALLLLHGCGGPYDRQGQLSRRMRDYAQRLRQAGFHVLITDSFTPRGERELCTQRQGARRVTQLQRRRDVLGALQWLAAQPGVDAQRLGLLGWSNGGSSVLAALDARQPEVQAAALRPAFAVAFYPGCGEDLRRGWTPVAPLLMLLGEADDWTPAATCHALAKSVALPAPRPQVLGFEGAYHGFDGAPPVRLRRDVPNGVHPGQGVHVGGDEAAGEAARRAMLDFLRRESGLDRP